MAKNAPKEDVLKKLTNSLNYCSSHHDPPQDRFDRLVNELIRPEFCKYDAMARAAEMKSLFPILLDSNTVGMIPSIPLSTCTVALEPAKFLDAWFEKWIRKFLKEWETLPSERVARQKGTVTDEALIAMVASSEHAGSDDKAHEWAYHHNLYMSAENVGGNLLEEYIASRVADYGWIWCRGEILTAIDFCADDCQHMFQVKNKSNTENSSGKGFRQSRGAQIWWRMRAERKQGEIVTYWPQLVELIREGATRGGSVPDDLMTEDDYLAFIRAVAQNNPDLINGEEG